MYVKYQWLATSTAAQVLADIGALVGGETSIANLSAGCDKANSAILASATASGWSIHDAAASATSKVVKALCADGVSYKYVQIDLTGGNLFFKGWESWNATAHTGLNQASSMSNLGNLSFPLNNAITNAVYILAKPTVLMIAQSPAVGNQVSLCVEFRRDTNATPVGYPCFGVASSYSGATSFYDCVHTSNVAWNTGALNLCRVKNPSVQSGDLTGTGITGSAYNMLRGMVNSVGSAYPPNPSYGGDGVAYQPMLPIFLAYHSGTNGSMSFLGQVLDVFLSLPTTVVASSLDEITTSTGEVFVAHLLNTGGKVWIKRE